MFRGDLGPLIVDDHDWNDDTPLVRQDDAASRVLLEELQAGLRAECMSGLGADGFTTGDDPMRKVACALCPSNFGPLVSAPQLAEGRLGTS